MKFPLAASAVASATGITLEFVDNRPIPENMPIQVAILAPVETAQEGSVVANVGVEFRTAKDVGDLCGFGSPAYKAARMVRPETGVSLGNIKSVIFPVLPGGGAVAASGTLDITIGVGGVTNNTRRYIVSNGRKIPFLILKGDEAPDIAARIKDAYDSAFEYRSASSVIVPDTALHSTIDFTALWKGASGNQIRIEITAGDVDDNVTFINPTFADGVGVFDVKPAVDAFGSVWYNIVINAVDEDVTVLGDLSDRNGSFETDPAGSGRCDSKVMKPFLSFYGSVESDQDVIIVDPDTMKSDICNVLIPAPGAETFTFEIAASAALDVAITASNNPAQAYVRHRLQGIPAPLAGDSAAGDFNDWDSLDYIERHGVSGVTLDAMGYMIQDMNTHYHPDNINPAASPYFRVVTMIKLFNCIYRYRLYEYAVLIGKILVSDVNRVSVPNAIDPKKFAQALKEEFLPGLEASAFIVNADEAKKTVDVQISGDNPDRTETAFRITISGTARQNATKMTFGFNYSN